MAELNTTPFREGIPFPCGATWDGKGVNFALFSAHATRVELCRFDSAGEREVQRIELLLHMLQLIATTREYSLLSSQGFSTSYDHTNTDRINLIYTYTFNNFHNPIHIKDVAAAANLSPHSFCRYFKTRTLKTYWQCLLEVRIGYACKLLIENKMSVAQICYECGFNNLSNFNRHFKAMLNRTPLQYTKAYMLKTA